MYISTGYFEIGGLLALGEDWQKLDADLYAEYKISKEEVDFINLIL